MGGRERHSDHTQLDQIDHTKPAFSQIVRAKEKIVDFVDGLTKGCRTMIPELLVLHSTMKTPFRSLLHQSLLSLPPFPLTNPT